MYHSDFAYSIPIGYSKISWSEFSKEDYELTGLLKNYFMGKIGYNSENFDDTLGVQNKAYEDASVNTISVEVTNL